MGANKEEKRDYSIDRGPHSLVRHTTEGEGGGEGYAAASCSSFSRPVSGRQR